MGGGRSVGPVKARVAGKGARRAGPRGKGAWRAIVKGKTKAKWGKRRQVRQWPRQRALLFFLRQEAGALGLWNGASTARRRGKIERRGWGQWVATGKRREESDGERNSGSFLSPASVSLLLSTLASRAPQRQCHNCSTTVQTRKRGRGDRGGGRKQTGRNVEVRNVPTTYGARSVGAARLLNLLHAARNLLKSGACGRQQSGKRTEGGGGKERL